MSAYHYNPEFAVTLLPIRWQYVLLTLGLALWALLFASALGSYFGSWPR